MESTTKAEGIKEEQQSIGKAHDLKYYLIKEKNDWDIEGFVLVKTENIEEWKESLIINTLLKSELGEFPLNIYLEDDNYVGYMSKEEALSTITDTEISINEYKMFKKHFKKSFGVICLLKFI
jgi:hypothetical protein